jgi:hypothetical protein
MKQEPGVKSRKPVTPIDLDRLDPERLQKIDELLAEGATFEDVVRTLNDATGEGIAEVAVENYFRSNLELQKRRVRRMVEKLEELKKSLGGPESAEGKLAEAALFTGLMGLTRKSTYIDLEDLEVLRLKRDKLNLERTIMEMKEKEARERRRMMQAQTNYVIVKCDKAKFELRKMMDLLRGLKRGDQLDAQTIGKIREIYGIIRQPYIEPENPAAPPQAGS